MYLLFTPIPARGAGTRVCARLREVGGEKVKPGIRTNIGGFFARLASTFFAPGDGRRSGKPPAVARDFRPRGDPTRVPASGAEADFLAFWAKSGAESGTGKGFE